MSPIAFIGKRYGAPGAAKPRRPPPALDHFHHSTAAGETAQHFGLGGKAADEVAALWAWAREQLGLSAGSLVNMSTATA
jgi:hypothetical protein